MTVVFMSYYSAITFLSRNLIWHSSSVGGESTVDVYKQSNRYQLCVKDKFPQSLIDMTTSNTIRTPPTIPSSL